MTTKAIATQSLRRNDGMRGKQREIEPETNKKSAGTDALALFACR